MGDLGQMSWKLPSLLADFTVIRSRDRAEDQEEEIASPFEFLRNVNEWLQFGYSRRLLEDIVLQVCARPALVITDADIYSELEAGLRSGRLVVLRHPRRAVTRTFDS